jgi:hypothetical protein
MPPNSGEHSGTDLIICKFGTQEKTEMDKRCDVYNDICTLKAGQEVLYGTEGCTSSTGR